MILFLGLIWFLRHRIRFFPRIQPFLFKIRIREPIQLRIRIRNPGFWSPLLVFINGWQIDARLPPAYMRRSIYEPVLKQSRERGHRAAPQIINYTLANPLSAD